LSRPDRERILFITASAPLTLREEAFVQDELTEMVRVGVDFDVAPMRRKLASPNPSAVDSGLADRTYNHRLIDAQIIVGAIAQLVIHPVVVLGLLIDIIRQAGGSRNLVANLMSLPKALCLGGRAKKSRVAHIHAYWLAHTSTTAMIAAKLADCSWSASGFRWDIDANNCLDMKLRQASFIRVADEFGQELVVSRAAGLGVDVPIVLIRTGVDIPEADSPVADVRLTEFCCAGAFVEKKAQGLLVDAFSTVRSSHPNVRLELFGDGELRQAVEDQVSRLGLTDAVAFRGTVPLADLRRRLQQRPVTVLPSIITADGQQEGIAVVLIEAMANRSPVISTHTGAIDHLVTDGCGLLVNPGNREELADAMRRILDADPAAIDSQCERAYQRVCSEFRLASTTARLVDLCRIHAVV